MSERGAIVLPEGGELEARGDELDNKRSQRTVPELDVLDHLTMITPRTTTTHRLRHQRLDPSLRSLAEFS
jgi:hypothetical protein